jgi:hypothetical protein
MFAHGKSRIIFSLNQDGTDFQVLHEFTGIDRYFYSCSLGGCQSKSGDDAPRGVPVKGTEAFQQDQVPENPAGK